jgi:hypothetical protein
MYDMKFAQEFNLAQNHMLRTFIMSALEEGKRSASSSGLIKPSYIASDIN